MKTFSKTLLLLLLALFTLNITASEAVMLPILPGPVNEGKVTMNKAKTFPKLKSKNLEGKEYSLPQELESEISIIILAYKREHQKDVDAWFTAIKENELDICPAVTSYEMPVLKQFNSFIRFNIDNGMRFGINDKVTREHILSVYVDKESFNKTLDISTEETIHTLVIKRNGEILWQKPGNVDDEKIADLKNYLKSLLD